MLTVNSKKENSEDFCLDFVQEFGLRLKSATCKKDFSSGIRSPYLVLISTRLDTLEKYVLGTLAKVNSLISLVQ